MIQLQNEPIGKFRLEPPRKEGDDYHWPGPKGRACFCLIWNTEPRPVLGSQRCQIAPPLLVSTQCVEDPLQRGLSGGPQSSLASHALGCTTPSPGSHMTCASIKNSQDDHRWLKRRTQKDQTAPLELAKMDQPFSTSLTFLGPSIPPVPYLP